MRSYRLLRCRDPSINFMLTACVACAVIVLNNMTGQNNAAITLILEAFSRISYWTVAFSFLNIRERDEFVRALTTGKGMVTQTLKDVILAFTQQSLLIPIVPVSIITNFTQVCGTIFINTFRKINNDYWAPVIGVSAKARALHGLYAFLTAGDPLTMIDPEQISTLNQIIYNIAWSVLPQTPYLKINVLSNVILNNASTSGLLEIQDITVSGKILAQSTGNVLIDSEQEQATFEIINSAGPTPSETETTTLQISTRAQEIVKVAESSNYVTGTLTTQYASVRNVTNSESFLDVIVVGDAFYKLTDLDVGGEHLLMYVKQTYVPLLTFPTISSTRATSSSGSSTTICGNRARRDEDDE